MYMCVCISQKDSPNNEKMDQIQLSKREAAPNPAPCMTPTSVN